MSNEDIKEQKSDDKTIEDIQKQVKNIAFTVRKLKDWLEKIMGADIDGDRDIGRVKTLALLFIFGIASTCLAGPHNTNIAVWAGTESTPTAYVDNDGNIHAPIFYGEIGASSLPATVVTNTTITLSRQGLASVTNATATCSPALMTNVTIAVSGGDAVMTNATVAITPDLATNVSTTSKTVVTNISLGSVSVVTNVAYTTQVQTNYDGVNTNIYTNIVSVTPQWGNVTLAVTQETASVLDSATIQTVTPTATVTKQTGAVAVTPTAQTVTPTITVTVTRESVAAVTNATLTIQRVP
jgi:hypothetical protein